MKYILPVLPLKRSLKLTVAAVCIIASSVYFWVTVPAQAATGINQTINFQGKLVDNNGLNVADGSYSVVFTLYDDPNAGSNLWDETQTVSTTDGLFQVALGSVDTSISGVNFNSDSIYLGIKVGSDSEMTPRIRFAAVPYAFNAQKVAGLTVTNTTGTLTIPNGKTIQFGDSFTTSGANALTLTTTGTTNITLPTTGTLLTNTASSNQTFTSTQTSGTVLGITDSTGLTGNATGLAITLSGSGAFDQTGLSFNLSNASGSNLNDIIGTGSSWKVSRSGDLTVNSCTGCGGGSNPGYFRINQGALSPVNDTMDFLLGGISSSAARLKFSPSGISPTASISAQTAQAALLVDNTIGDLFTASSSGLTRFVIKNNGNVGIGSITNPQATLDVRGNVSTVPVASISGHTSATAFSVNNNGAGNLFSVAKDGGTKFLIDNNGNIGVGTTSPQAKIHINSTIGNTDANYYNQLSTIARSNASDMGGYSDTGYYVGLSNSNAITNALASGLDYMSGVTSYASYTGDITGGTAGRVIRGGYFESSALGTVGPNNFSKSVGVYANAQGSTTGAGISSTYGIFAEATNGDYNYAGVFNGNVVVGTDAPYFYTGAPVVKSTLDVRGNSGTLAVASVSGTTSIASMFVDNNGVGDLFTASKSGATKFVIKNDGTIGLDTANYTNCGSLTTNASALIACGTSGSGGNGDDLLGVYAITTHAGINLTVNFNGAADSTPSSSSGTITFPSNTSKLMVEVKGAGGGGGGTAGATAVKNAGGGGEGGYAREFIANVVSNYYIKVGGGGTGGTAGANGGTGTQTCFGINATDACNAPLLNATGGAGGAGVNSAIPAAGGAGGLGAGGDINMNGQAGFTSSAVLTTSSWSGAGGGSGGAPAVTVAGNGTNGTTGGGGSGAGGIVSSATARNGGAGGSGYVLIYVYKNTGDANGSWNQFGNGVLAPDNLMTDVLIGGNATSSAKFGFLNVSNGNPTASISAGLSGAIYMTSQGTIQTTANQSLVLGGTTTGNILLNPQGQNFVGIGTNSPMSPLDVRTSLGTVSTASISANSSFAALVVDNKGVGDIFTASSSGMNRFVVKQSGNVGIGTTLPLSPLEVNGKIQTTNAGTNNAGDINTGSGGFYSYSSAGRYLRFNTAGVVNDILSEGVPLTINYSGGQNVNIGPLGLAPAAQLQVIGNLSVGNADGTTAPTNGAAFGGKVGIGTNNPLGALDVRGLTTHQPAASVSAQTTAASLIVDNKGTGHLFAASSSGLGRFVIKQSGDVAMGTAAINSVSNYGTLQNFTNNFVASGAIQSGVINDRGAIALLPGAGGPTDSGSLQMYDQNGNSMGALFSDASGLTLEQTGGTIILDSSSLRVTNLTAASCDVKASITGVLSCGTDATGTGGANYLNLANGAFSLVNNTADFLIGGTATSSAKFAFGGINTSTPMATFSGDLMFGSQPDSTFAQQTAWNNVSSATPGTISGATTQIASISAMTSYNGNLYVGTSKSVGTVGSAEVYRYDMNGTNWTKVSNATAGTIGTGTTNIASVSAMTVYDGRLYAGTSKIDQAEIYRYDGGTTWTRVSFTTAGTIASGVTTGIDGITSMAVYNGRLYAGTSDGARAELYRYDGGINWTRINSAAGTFVATNTVNVQAVTSMVVRNGSLYLGTRKAGDADVLRYDGGNTFTAMNNAGTTGSYTVNGAAVTAYDDVTAMINYNGALVVALRRGGNQADVLMLSGGSQGAGVDTWSRMTNAVGQLNFGGTANIDEVTSLYVYNGLLYAGTREKDNAEIYRYTGEDQKWLKVSQANGTLESGGTANIDGVVGMAQTNGSLFAGTHEILRAEVYQLPNVNINKSYGLKFHAQPSIVGEGGTGENTASIFYMASASANLSSSAGNSGAFIFSHGIQTRTGSYDVAEDYPTRDDSLAAGDLVSINPNERGLVKKSEGEYDATVLGVVSENPALRLTQTDTTIDGAKAIPVALAGRVPVKVSTENGVIKPGDSLTASSIPGVAMKATKAGLVIGQAMSGYDEDGVGKVLAYIKSTSYAGSSADAFAAIDMNAASSGKDILAALKTQKPSAHTSEVVTDRVIAGLEMISPKITADFIFAKKIEADEFVLTAEGWKKLLASGGLDMIEARFAAQDVRMTKLENLFASTSAKPNEELPQASESSSVKSDDLSFTNLSVAGLATVSANLRVKGNSLVEGVLNVVDTLTVGNFIVNRMANFFGDVIFHSDVVFRGRAIFNNDTAGVAVIKKGSDRVDVKFTKEYDEAPVVSANLVLGQITKAPSQSDEELEEIQNTIERKILDEGLRYVVTRRTNKGFTIVLKETAAQDLTFSWTALATEKQSITEGSKPVAPTASQENIDPPKQEDRIEPASHAREDDVVEQEGGDNDDST